MNNYEVKPKQSLFDISIEVYGDVQGVVWLCRDNPDLAGVTGPIYAGQKLKIRTERINTRQLAYLADFAPFQTINEGDQPSGISYWSTEQYIVN